MSTTMTRSTTRITIKINQDCPSDPSSRWTAFASSEGIALPKFAGKSWKSEQAACKAAHAWLDEMDARIGSAVQPGNWTASTADDVLTH
jgi:hypothetical protein